MSVATLERARRSTTPSREPHVERGFDLLAVPVLGRFLRWRHARLALQLPLFALAVGVVLHGLFGPQLAPKNLATVLPWVHYRGVLVFVLLLAGNLFCMACPFLVPRELARLLTKPARAFPRRLRNKWAAVGLFVAVLFAYELFDLWSTPWWTAWLIVGYFALALVVDALFQGAPFCKFLCPIGQFNFVASTVSPLEVRVADAGTCTSCATKDCIRGTRAPARPQQVVQRGCELALFVPRKVGNLDCTLCLDCVHACPEENIVVGARLPASELWLDPLRSGIGRLSKRLDLAALVVVFVFGALLNAFGMVTPVYALEQAIAERLGTTSEAPVLGLIFVAALVLEPLVLLGLAGWLSGRARGAGERVLDVVTRYVWALVPLGFAVWLAHYAFHFLTGLWTFVPVVESALAQAGLPLGKPHWRLGGIDARFVSPIETGFLLMGLAGSLSVAWNIARDHSPRRTARAFAPWAFVTVLLFLCALWLMNQPMEMRGTFLGT